MATTQLNPLLENLNGSIGDLVIYKRAGRLIISRKPDLSRRVLSPAQQKQFDRFPRATQYAAEAMADPARRASYETAAKQTGKPVRSLAIAEYLKVNVG
ncbi:MAG: hypothetical protein QM790_02235 [Nibricoccus sp.]